MEKRDLKGFRVLFVFPNLNLATNLMPERVTRYSSPDSPHYGIAQLAAVLRDQNSVVKIFDMRLGYSFDDLVSVIKEFKPDMIGFTLIATRIKMCYAMINKVKELFPNIKIGAGGTHVASFKQKILEECPKLDFGILQEGEQTFVELIDAINHNDTEYAKIKGLMFREQGKIITTEPMPMWEDLNVLPYPAYDLFELEKYYGWRQGIVPIVTSRGCPFRCVFCSINLTMGYKFRNRSPENVVDEMQFWHDKFGRTKFDINDDEFTFMPKRVEEICDLIVAKGLKIELRLNNGIRVTDVYPELLAKMKKAGFTAITYALESGSDKVLKDMRKAITVEKGLKAAELTKAAGIETTVNFIIGHPNETYEDALQTLEVIKQVKADKINFNNAVPYPGTELYQWIEDHGKFVIDVEEYLNFSHPGKYNTPFFETKEFTKAQRMELLRKGILLYRSRLIHTRMKEPFASVYSFLARSDLVYSTGEILKTSKVVNKYLKPIFFRKYGVNASS